VAAEAFFGGVDVVAAVSDGASDFAEVDVVGDDQSRNHFADKALPA
jgi:hypothetical protein